MHTPRNKLFSPNHRPRNGDERVRLVVIHSTYMAADEAALEHLCNPATQVSCHYYIMRNGAVLQLVPEDASAWHAGKSRWDFEDRASVEGLNAHSIGIELGNAGPFGHTHPAGPPPELEQALEGGADWAQAEPFPDVQIQALIELLKDILQRHNLKPAAVVGHCHIAPGRKTDPGPHFPWEKVLDELRGVKS